MSWVQFRLNNAVSKIKANVNAYSFRLKYRNANTVEAEAERLRGLVSEALLKPVKAQLANDAKIENRRIAAHEGLFKAQCYRDLASGTKNSIYK